MGLVLPISNPYDSDSENGYIKISQININHQSKNGSLLLHCFHNKETRDNENKKPLDYVLISIDETPTCKTKEINVNGEEVYTDDATLSHINYDDIVDQTRENIYSILKQYQVKTNNAQILDLTQSYDL